jgi:hypothetical protein
VLANTEMFWVRSEKFHGGAGLRRCNRFRGFLQISQDTEIYAIITESFGTKFQKAWNNTAMAAAATVPQIPVDFKHGRSQEAG